MNFGAKYFIERTLTIDSNEGSRHVVVFHAASVHKTVFEALKNT